jgi:hypothetical protein
LVKQLTLAHAFILQRVIPVCFILAAYSGGNSYRWPHSHGYLLPYGLIKFAHKCPFFVPKDKILILWTIFEV